MENTESNEAKDAVKLYVGANFPGKKMQDLLTFVNLSFQKSIVRCYTEFCSPFQPILMPADVSAIVSKFKETNDPLWSLFWQLLGFDRCAGNNCKCKHLREVYERIMFNHLLSTSRLRNSKNVAHWANVQAGASYSCGDSEATNHWNTFFGHESNHQTLLRVVRRYAENMEKTLFVLLEADNHFWHIFDNKQKRYQLEFQRCGKINVFIKVTGRTVI